jgi:tetratricopeptide (TPR) repeat protein
MKTPPTLAGLLLAGAVACGCGDADIPAPAPTQVEQPQPLIVQEGTDLCFRSLHGEVELRQAAIDKLEAATALHPENARAYFMLGMCSLAMVAEGGSVAFGIAANEHLSRAIELDPMMTRALGFRALVRARIALATSNEQGLEDAIQLLIEAAEIDQFNFFPMAIMFSRFDLDTGYPQQAMEAFERNQGFCASPAADSTCDNSDLVRHREAAYRMQLGDTYARVGEKTKAEQAYAAALADERAGTWRYAPEAQAWASALDERLALHADTDPSNDPEYFLSGSRTCVGCHE